MVKNPLKKVRVFFKNPIGNKSKTMQIRSETIKFYKTPSGKKFSPYKKITIIK